MHEACIYSVLPNIVQQSFAIAVLLTLITMHADYDSRCCAAQALEPKVVRILVRV